MIAADDVVSVAPVTAQYVARYVWCISQRQPQHAQHAGTMPIEHMPAVLCSMPLHDAGCTCYSAVVRLHAQLQVTALLSSAVTHNQSEQVGHPVTHQAQPRLEATLLAVAPGCFLKVCHSLLGAAAAAQLLHDCR